MSHYTILTYENNCQIVVDQMYRVLFGCLVLAQGAFLQSLLILEIAISE